MNGSFYTAALGAGTQQTKIDIIANNIANVNTLGYKAKNGVFTDLVYRNMERGAGGERLQAGVGVKINSINTDFSNVGYQMTGMQYDFAIPEDGFFMLQDPVTNEISYTRSGRFSLSRSGDEIYLVAANGKRVLNKDQEQIVINMEESAENDGDAGEEEEETTGLNIGIFDFRLKNGMSSNGDNEFIPAAKNGEPILLENQEPIQGALELSGVNFANEMAKLVETQRAYSYALKMLQTSDEVESMINSLR